MAWNPEDVGARLARERDNAEYAAEDALRKSRRNPSYEKWADKEHAKLVLLYLLAPMEHRSRENLVDAARSGAEGLHEDGYQPFDRQRYRTELLRVAEDLIAMFPE